MDADIINNKKWERHVERINDFYGIVYGENPDGTLKVIGANSKLSEISIPPYMYDKKVTVIDDCALAGNTINRLRLPDTIVKIGEYAFQDCKGLCEIVIPNSVESIGAKAFEGCSNVMRVIIGRGVKEIGERAFDGCYSVKCVYNLSKISYTKPSPQKDYDENALGGLGGARYVFNEIPSYLLTSIYGTPYSLTDSQGIMYATLPNGTYAVVSYVGYDSIVSVPQTYMGVQVTQIKELAFAFKTSITTLKLPRKLHKIGKGALVGCTSLEELEIPFVGGGGLKDIWRGSEAFGYIFGEAPYKGGELTPQSIKNYDLLDAGPTIYKFYIPSSLRKVKVNSDHIPANAFCNCANLERVLFSDELKTIGHFAFRGCTSLSQITLPKNLVRIVECAFLGCKNLKTVYNYSNLKLTKGGNCLDNGGVAEYAENVYTELPDNN